MTTGSVIPTPEASAKSDAPAGRFNLSKWAMQNRRLNAISPRPFVQKARCGKRRSRKLFGVKSEWHSLRRIASDGQRAFHGFGGEHHA